MSEITMPVERITRREIDTYKREVLEAAVLVTPRDAAAMLACSTRKVRELVHEGALAGYNAGQRGKGLRILAAELRAYVQSIKVDRDTWRE